MSALPPDPYCSMCCLIEERCARCRGRAFEHSAAALNAIAAEHRYDDEIYAANLRREAEAPARSRKRIARLTEQGLDCDPGLELTAARLALRAAVDDAASHDADDLVSELEAIMAAMLRASGGPAEPAHELFTIPTFKPGSALGRAVLNLASALKGPAK